MANRKTIRPPTRAEYYRLPPSQVVRYFLDWLKDMEEEQEEAWEIVTTEDDRVQDFLHEIEFEGSSKKRSLIDTRFHNSRVKRREAKDKSKALKPVRDFVADATNRGFIKRLKKLQTDLKAIEDFQASDRIYKPRVRDKEEGATE